ncbi:hypothetical protein KEJ37_07465 [Candidatus Bathyarchaeota archaeon]|nr:hypothetical protein [Candidatus Bathyarchaeota archaeon]
MRLIKYMVKALITSPAVVGWSILYTLFWLTMGAYIFSATASEVAALTYTASWFATCVVISISSFAISLGFTLNYQTGGLSHLFRYSKLTPRYYLVSAYVSSLVCSFLLGLVLMVCSIGMFSHRFGVELFPKDLATVLFAITIAAVFFASLSIVLNAVALKVTRKVRAAVFFAPFLVSYVSAMAYIYLKMGNLIYFNPFVCIQLLSMSGYLGEPPLQNFPDYQHLFQQTINNVEKSSIPMLFGSIIGWTVFLTVIALAILRQLYLKPVEEERVV